MLMGLDGTDRGARKVAQLHDNANYMRARLVGMGLDVLGGRDSPVVPVMTYNPMVKTVFSRCGGGGARKFFGGGGVDLQIYVCVWDLLCRCGMRRQEG